MNQDSQNNLPGDESDPKVSAEYRAIATERTPPDLDAEVLKKAEAVVKDTGLRGFTAFWFRPLAFVATLGLSLALLLELTQAPDVQFVESPEFESGRLQPEPTVADPPQAEIGATSEVSRSVDSPPATNRRSEPSGKVQWIIRDDDAAISPPATAISPATDERPSADFAIGLEESAKLMQERDPARADALHALTRIRADNDVEPGNVATLQRSASFMGVVARPCTEEQIDVAATWWRCIADLEEAGRGEEAKAELDLFNVAYPDFEPPEVVPSQ
jgi:hypothetical protein